MYIDTVSIYGNWHANFRFTCQDLKGLGHAGLVWYFCIIQLFYSPFFIENVHLNYIRPVSI